LHAPGGSRETEARIGGGHVKTARAQCRTEPTVVAAKVKGATERPLDARKPVENPLGEMIDQKAMLAKPRRGPITAQSAYPAVENLGRGHRGLVPRGDAGDKQGCHPWRVPC
jgi:hypothetical protein